MNQVRYFTGEDYRKYPGAVDFDDGERPQVFDDGLVTILRDADGIQIMLEGEIGKWEISTYEYDYNYIVRRFYALIDFVKGKDFEELKDYFNNQDDIF